MLAKKKIVQQKYLYNSFVGNFSPYWNQNNNCVTSNHPQLICFCGLLSDVNSLVFLQAAIQSKHSESEASSCNKKKIVNKKKVQREI